MYDSMMLGTKVVIVLFNNMGISYHHSSGERGAHCYLTIQVL